MAIQQHDLRYSDIQDRKHHLLITTGPGCLVHSPPREPTNKFEKKLLHRNDWIVAMHPLQEL